jgi:hypothetical protein
MRSWRTLGIIAVVLAGASTVRAQDTYLLAEEIKPGDCFRIEINLDVDGELRVSREGRPVPLKLAATARHAYPERVLHIGKTGLIEKTARVYETARAEIKVMDSRSQRALRTERRLVVAQYFKDQRLAYCPAGPLTREEVELIEGHFDSLCLTGLLPGKEVKVGETWKVLSPVVQGLCHFEGLSEQDLVCKLEKVEGKIAHVSVTGAADGIDLGAMAKVKIQAAYQFDLKEQRLVQLEWKQQDEREQGPASPASTVRARTILKRARIDEPRELNNVALVSVPDGMQPPEAMTYVEHREMKDRFDLTHGREWHLVGQTSDHVVLRMLDRGDFVAQLTVTPWTPADKGKHISADEFRRAMAETPGWEPEKELQAGEVPAEGGRWIYRLSSLGQMDGMPVLQNFYVVAAPSGEQVVLVFTMAPRHAERLGTRDLSIAGSIDFPASRMDRKP